MMIDSEEMRAKRRAEWKRIQALQPGYGTLLAPTLPERIARLNPMERHELGVLLKSMKLRKIIKRTLAEAFWAGEQRKALEQLQLDEYGSMPKLRAAIRAQETLQHYDRALENFEPVYTRSTYGDGNDPPAVTRALERSLIIQP